MTVHAQVTAPRAPCRLPGPASSPCAPPALSFVELETTAAGIVTFGTELTRPGPALVDVLTRRQELAVPPSTTFAQTKGSTLWATRSVLSGNRDEGLDVAEANLRRLSLE